MKNKLSCSTNLLLYALLVIVFTVRKASTQCTTNGCTICNETVLACEGLITVPSLEDMDVSNIERISLTNGAISEIPARYFNLSNLESIDLSSNQLTTFNMESLEYATRLRTIRLTNNPIVCDGNIDWLQKWKTFYPPGNRVTGTCAVSGEDINGYLSDKPAKLVAIKFDGPSIALDRTCPEVTLPFLVTGDFDIDLEYRVLIAMPPRSVEIDVVNEYITVPVGANSTNVTIAVTNRGENREDVEIFVQVYTKYPVSYETQVEVKLLNGANTGCEAPVPVITATTMTPVVTQGRTTKPSVRPTQGGPKTMPPKETTESAPTSKPEPTPTTPPTTTPPPRFPVWVIILIIIIVIVTGVVVFIYMKYKKPNKTAGDKTVEYKVVKGEDGQVYNKTTEDA